MSEHNGLLRYRDAENTDNILYPITRLACVDGAREALDGIHDNFQAVSDALTASDFTDIPYARIDGYFVNAKTGLLTSRSMYFATDFVDISLYRQITFRRIGITWEATTIGIAFYTDRDESTYVEGVLSIPNLSDYGYSDAILYNVPFGVRYARFTGFLDSALYGEFMLRGVSKLAGDGLIGQLNSGNIHIVEPTRSAECRYGYTTGFFSRKGKSKTTSGYYRNALPIRIPEGVGKLVFSVPESLASDYNTIVCFSDVPSMENNAENADIFIEGYATAISNEIVINAPSAGLYYISFHCSKALSEMEEFPLVCTSDAERHYSNVSYTRNYTDVTWSLTFERKQIAESGIADSTSHVLVRLPNIGNVEVRSNRAAAKFAVFRVATDGSITRIQDYTPYQYRFFADYESAYYADIQTPAEDALTVSAAMQYISVYTFTDAAARYTVETKLAKDSIAVIGDSIVQGRYHNALALTSGTNSCMQKAYPYLLAEIVGMKNPINFGLGGAMVARTDGSWNSLYDNCANVAGYDVVFVHAGTNDYGGNISEADFTEAYAYVLDTLIANNTRVVVCTPTYRADKDAANGAGLALSDYAELEKTIAKSKGCTVIDLYAMTAGNDNFIRNLSDGLHPNEVGQGILANLILQNYKA